MQKLDPPGVAARDLRECLLLQLVPGMRCYEQLKTLISIHLEDIEHNRLPVIERKTGYSIPLIQLALAELRTLTGTQAPPARIDANTHSIASGSLGE